jgi:type II secretory pathway component PulJ
MTVVTCQPVAAARRGFSLTELFVAMTIALLVMGAVARLFVVFGRGVSQSQATVELSGKMRSTAWQLRQDLAGATAKLVPRVAPEANAGYFELLEGPQRDDTLAGHGTANLEADTDDILLFTTRSMAGPFVGRYGTGTIEADHAEVAWFCREAGADFQPVAGTKVYNLHRRQMLVAGFVGRPEFGTTNSISGALPAAYTTYDLSLRAEGGVLLPNSLGDLTKRENRFMRSGTFPHALRTDAGSRAFADATFDDTDRVWEDVLLTNVIAFDVRVYDPQAKAQTGASTTRFPGDPGYVVGSAAGASGAYVDLGWGGGTATAIASGTAWPPAGQTAFGSAGMRVRNAATNNTLPVATYDTWSLHYEFNGEDDDGDGIVDEGTNGADNNADDQPDNPPEYETSPPYPVPLRGLEVRIRCYEPSSKQVRQITVRHTFVDR